MGQLGWKLPVRHPAGALPGYFLLGLIHLPADGPGAFLGEALDFLQIFLRRHAFFDQEPPLHRTKHRIGEEIQRKLVHLLLSGEQKVIRRSMERELVTEKVFAVLKDLKANLDETEETAEALERFTALVETEREKQIQ